jgi:hypothetical protein
MQLSLSGHSTFPSVRAGMAEPWRFATALNWAYTAMAVTLTAITTIGYWYWGSTAHTLVTEDFDLSSPYARYTIGGVVGIHKVVEVIVILNIGTTVPLLVLSLQDILHSFFSTEEQSGHPHSGYLVCFSFQRGPWMPEVSSS